MLQQNIAEQGHIQITYCPLEGAPENLEIRGQRLLIGAGGTWIEVNNHWLHARAKLCDCPGTEEFFGRVENTIQLKCGQIPGELLSRMVSEACFDFPKRFIARIFWNESTGDFRYSSGSAEHSRDELLILDARSIGRGETIYQLGAEKSSHPIIDCMIGGIDTEFPYTYCVLRLDGVSVPLDPFEPVLHLYDSAS